MAADFDTCVRRCDLCGPQTFRDGRRQEKAECKACKAGLDDANADAQKVSHYRLSLCVELQQI